MGSERTRVTTCRGQDATAAVASAGTGQLPGQAPGADGEQLPHGVRPGQVGHHGLQRRDDPAARPGHRGRDRRLPGDQLTVAGRDPGEPGDRQRVQQLVRADQGARGVARQPGRDDRAGDRSGGEGEQDLAERAGVRGSCAPEANDVAGAGRPSRRRRPAARAARPGGPAGRWRRRGRRGRPGRAGPRSARLRSGRAEPADRRPDPVPLGRALQQLGRDELGDEAVRGGQRDAGQPRQLGQRPPGAVGERHEDRRHLARDRTSGLHRVTRHRWPFRRP